MKNWLAALGLLCAVAPLAHANEVGVVSKFEGSNVVLTVGLLTLRAGEEVSLSVIPQRGNGSGRAVVTDVDPYTHHVALALLPLNGASGEPSPLAVTHGGFRLTRDDTVRLRSLGSFVKNPPEYRLDRTVVTPSPDHVDIDLPEGFVAPKTATGSAVVAPAGSLPTRRGPDVDALLRGLPSGAGAEDPTESTAETPESSLTRTPSKGKAGEMRMVALASSVKSRAK